MLAVMRQRPWIIKYPCAYKPHSRPGRGGTGKRKTLDKKGRVTTGAHQTKMKAQYKTIQTHYYSFPRQRRNSFHNE